MANDSTSNCVPDTDYFSGWPSSWLSCVVLGGLTFTFALLAFTSAIVVGQRRCRSRPAQGSSLSGRDSLALLLLGSQPANLALGLVAIWFGVVSLPGFLTEPTCTGLMTVGVVSQWNVAISTPAMTAYYALLVAYHHPSSPVTNQAEQRGPGAGPEQDTAEHGVDRDPIHVVEGAGREGNNANQETEHAANDLPQSRLTSNGLASLLGCGRGKFGVLTVICVVNSLTLLATFLSLSDVLIGDGEGNPTHSSCARFFACPGTFPRRALGGTFIASAVLTVAAILALSRELERKSIRRHAVGVVNPADVARLQSFSRPPDEGVHFHHYADPPPPLPDIRVEEAEVDENRPRPNGEDVDRANLHYRLQRLDERWQGPAGPATSSVRVEYTSRTSASTQGLLSDLDFYDPERTRHYAQSPPPMSPMSPRSHISTPGTSSPRLIVESHSNSTYRLRTPRVFSGSFRETPSNPSSQSSFIGTGTPATGRTSWRPQGSNQTAGDGESIVLISRRPRQPVTIGRLQPQQSNLVVPPPPPPQQPNSFASLPPQEPNPIGPRPPHQPVPIGPHPQQPASRDHRGVEQAGREEQNRSSMLRRLRRWAFLDLIFPHRQTGGLNRKRFSHTRVEHVREELVPPSPAPSSGCIPSSALTLPELVTCHIVCVSGALFVFTYTIVALYLLMTPAGRWRGQTAVQYRFSERSFEPFVAFLLLKGFLDAFFSFAALSSLTPGWSEQ